MNLAHFAGFVCLLNNSSVLSGDQNGYLLDFIDHPVDIMELSLQIGIAVLEELGFPFVVYLYKYLTVGTGLGFPVKIRDDIP